MAHLGHPLLYPLQLKLYSAAKKTTSSKSMTFGDRIRKARKKKGYSQRDLAELMGLDYSYISKLENDRAGYPPSEEVLKCLAHHLDLDKEELFYLAGRITSEEIKILEELAKVYQKQMPVLLSRMRDYPDLVKKFFDLQE